MFLFKILDQKVHPKKSRVVSLSENKDYSKRQNTKIETLVDES